MEGNFKFGVKLYKMVKVCRGPMLQPGVKGGCKLQSRVRSERVSGRTI